MKISPRARNLRESERGRSHSAFNDPASTFAQHNSHLCYSLETNYKILLTTEGQGNKTQLLKRELMRNNGYSSKLPKSYSNSFLIFYLILRDIHSLNNDIFCLFVCFCLITLARSELNLLISTNNLFLFHWFGFQIVFVLYIITCDFIFTISFLLGKFSFL